MPRPRRSPQNRIPDLRRARGWTQEQLAARIGVRPSTVSRWESRLTGVDDHRKGQLASVFEVTEAYLMCWETAADDARAYRDEVTA